MKTCLSCLLLLFCLCSAQAKTRKAVYIVLDGIPADYTVVLSWKSEKTSADATIYMATTNRFASGGTDEWKVVGKVKARSGRYVVDLSQYPSSKFYKFAVATPCNVLTRWVYK